jgi:hypothetical protein
MDVIHPAMGRLWVWAWACLLVVGFATQARADDPGFLPLRVCVRPPEVPATVWAWGYPSGGPVLLLLRRKPWMRERFLETSHPFPIYIFDPDAPAANTKQLPIPYRKLPCAPEPPAENKEVTEPFSPRPPAAPRAETKNEAKTPPPQPFVFPRKEPEPERELRPRLPNHGVTTDWPRTVLPIVCPSVTRTTVLPTRTVLPRRGRWQIGGARTVAAAPFDGTTEGDKIELVQWKGRSGLCGGPVVAAPAPGMKKPEPPPPGGKNYAENKAILKAREDAEKAERLGNEQGYKFGKTLGDAREGLKTLNSSTGGRFKRTLETNPKLVEELQAGLAAKLNAIPALPADVNPKLARPGFERGFRAGLWDAKLASVVVDFATNVALALSGDLAILAEQAGATALRAALARLKRMPVFVPGAIDGGGAFVRLPKPQIAQAARGDH